MNTFAILAVVALLTSPFSGISNRTEKHSPSSKNAITKSIVTAPVKPAVPLDPDCSSSPESNYLNVNTNPCNPNGVDPNNPPTGYPVLMNLPHDACVTMQFKNPITGSYYWQTGILPKGTAVYVSSTSSGPGDGGVCAVCSNIYSNWRWMV